MKSAQCLELARGRGIKIATAESCTGGLIAAALTDVAGSSDVFERGFVTYSNEAKAEMLGVPPELIETHGAVSRQVAEAMARGAITQSNGTLSVAVTGIAGPGGGSAEKPVGLVFIASAQADGSCTVHKHLFAEEMATAPTREAIREATLEAALELLIAQMSDAGP